MSNDTGRRSGETPLAPIDWEQENSTDRTVPWRFLLFSAGLVGLWLLYRYTNSHGIGVVYPWRPTKLTWLFRVSLLALVCFALPSLVRNTRRNRRYWERFRSNRLAVVSLVSLILFAILAMVGPALLGRPATDPTVARQPPLLFSSKLGLVTSTCVGPTVNGFCHGSLAYPLGTSTLGQDMVLLVLSGMHVSLQVGVIIAVLMIPLATVVGLVAGYSGGAVDTVLMRYVDVQQSVPAFVVYLIFVFLAGPSLFVFVVVFGLLNWGSIARLVRSEVIQRREEEYVEAARSAGVSRWTILRKHLLPNVSNTVLIGTTQKIPQLVLLETALTFIGIGDVGRFAPSFGDTIATGLLDNFYTIPIKVWWIWTIPVVVLVFTVVALSIVGDTLRDVFDPRGDV
ncbi:ABC transporter permease subunit [Haladaptatus sp. AB643]|uniref:ABC transporter permease n=1 Tax=unclassified Haladaptatus TaxID=2622732 RepID=UPI00209C331D|nr:ABC transporter permease [Haladaptatus sp. AB643]MCO8255369.1 ABC transporter permease [Haladaptatus sp. AB618]